jgi:hypothetical protein
MIFIVWFNTDAVVHYLQLLNLFEKARLDYLAFTNQNPLLYFPDFLYKVSLRTQNRVLKFLLKLLSCPFCIGVWLSFTASIFCTGSLIYLPCFYVTSIGVFFGLRKFIF